jgi:glycerol kinase
MAYQTRELIEAMEGDSGARLAELRVDGGAAGNNFLMQFQADILDRPVVRPADPETTALGAALLAGLATGYWGSVQEVESFWRAERTFEPRMAASVFLPPMKEMPTGTPCTSPIGTVRFG